MGVRFSLLIIVFFGAYSYLLFHLYELQLRSGDNYLAQAESQVNAAVFSQAKRGAIYFTDKDNSKLPAAINKNFPTIFAVPKTLEDPASAATKISEALNIPAPDLQKQFLKKPNYYLLERKAGDTDVSKIGELNLPGIYIQDVPERFYPFGPLASQLLGFVSPNQSDSGSSGKYGLERFYEDSLAGTAGNAKDGKITSGNPGKDLNLTIDSNIQKEAETVLDDLIAKNNAPGGTVIVEDPQTGKILAMGSSPGFDPNNYSVSDISSFQNPATEQIYEPGSVMKLITMSAGIDAGKITPDTTFVDTGKLVIYDHTIHNWDLKAHGKVTMTNVLELSLNTGAAFAEHQTGNDIFKAYLQKFGLGDKTGIDLPGEVAGSINTLGPKAPPVLFATAAFGQGVAVTSLEMINAVAAIANGGKLMRPYVNSDLSPQVIRQAVSPDTAAKVTKMMISAVDKAKLAQINGYSIAGKSGTAQVPDFKNGGYSDKVIDSYIGFAPTNNPKFIILIKLDEPEGAPLAGTTVVPAFKDLAQFILNYYNVSPDRINQ